MRVSVITASYNRERSIVRAISSVKEQTYSDIQAVIIDGCSVDNTVSLVTPLLSEGDVLKSEPDRGIYDALNKGIKVSSGDILAFLHSDDLYFDSSVISNVVAYFADDSIDIVYGDVCFFSGDDIYKIKRLYRSDKLSKRNLAWGKMPAHPAIFIRRRVYERLGCFSIDFEIAADYEFLCRVVQDENVKAVYYPSILVRMQLGGASTKGIKNTYTLNKEVLRAVRSSGIYTNAFMVLSKYPAKLLQFFDK